MPVEFTGGRSPRALARWRSAYVAKLDQARRSALPAVKSNGGQGRSAGASVTRARPRSPPVASQSTIGRERPTVRR